MKFQAQLVKYAQIPATLTANFEELKDAGIVIASSEDNLVRFYSWNTQLGGTMRIFYNVLQYKNGNTVQARASREKNFEAGKFFNKIYTHRVDGDAYYLAISNSGKLTLDYNFFSVVDRPERPIKLIKYDKAKDVIQLALVDTALNVTKKFINYKFTGKYFDRQ